MKVTVDVPEGKKLMAVSPLEERFMLKTGELLMRVRNADQALMPDDVMACARDAIALYQEAIYGSTIGPEEGYHEEAGDHEVPS